MYMCSIYVYIHIYLEIYTNTYVYMYTHVYIYNAYDARKQYPHITHMLHK